MLQADTTPGPLHQPSVWKSHSSGKAPLISLSKTATCAPLRTSTLLSPLLCSHFLSQSMIYYLCIALLTKSSSVVDVSFYKTWLKPDLTLYSEENFPVYLRERSKDNDKAGPCQNTKPTPQLIKRRHVDVCLFEAATTILECLLWSCGYIILVYLAWWYPILSIHFLTFSI